MYLYAELLVKRKVSLGGSEDIWFLTKEDFTLWSMFLTQRLVFVLRGVSNAVSDVKQGSSTAESQT